MIVTRPAQSTALNGPSGGLSAGQRANSTQLTPAQQREVDKLKATDRAVRDHEMAHMRVGAGLITSAANYSYTYGPDGKRYAVGGEVGIDASSTGEPQKDIEKGRRVEAAALAPADPSPQDHSVANAARQMVMRGQIDLSAQRQQERVANAYGASERGLGSAIDISA